MKKCIIIGAGEFSGFRPDFTADFIIAADGGFDNLVRFGLKADLIVGDCDSIEARPDVETIRFPAEKNASDLELAVEEAIKRGFNCFYIYGALGKRLDHTLGNIAVLASISRKCMFGYLIGENETITAISNGKITLESHNSGFISIFPAGDRANGVCLSGLKYTLNNATLTFESTHGLSNEFIGKKAVVEVNDGTLIIIV